MRLLDHPNVVKVHVYTECPLGFYMDYIDGPNLRNLSNLADPIDVIRMLVVIAETLRHAHDRGVVHRDIKPENIIASYSTEAENWVPHLTDFDLAWFSTATLLTDTKAFGSMYYAAPEQLTKPKSAEAKENTVDVFSFGQLLYFAVTGRDPIPFKSTDNEISLSQAVRGWSSAKAAEFCVNLYTELTPLEASDRLKSFSRIVRRLTRILQNLTDAGEWHSRDALRFLREVSFSIVGLRTSINEQQTTVGFVSLSGRTSVELRVLDLDTESLPLISLQARLSMTTKIAIEGITNFEKARAVLNQRIDQAIRPYKEAMRHPGSQGPFETYIDFKELALNSSGVDLCRAALLSAINAIERA